MNFMGVGNLEILVVLTLALLILGPKRLASTARSLGQVIGQLRQASENLPNLVDEILEGTDDPKDKRDLQSAPLPSPPQTQPRRRRGTPSMELGDKEPEERE